MSLVEDIVQDSFYAALDDWPKKGVPDNPTAWLFRVCKNKTINALRRKDMRHPAFYDFYAKQNEKAKIDQLFMPHQIKDNQLRLLFATCHPSLAPKSQIILTLKTCAGFRIVEIATALDMKVEAVKKNLSRAKQRLTVQNLPLKVPYALQSRERLHTVHQVLYLIFNEGYSASQGAFLIRTELCLEATRLVRSLLEEDRIPNSDTYALYALMLFNCARLDARTNEDGIAIELEHQDRSLWDYKMIELAIAYFNKARKAPVWSNYHLEAGIASLHCTAQSFEATPWQHIVRLYDRLLKRNRSPLVQMNRYIALFYEGKQQEALLGVQQLNGLGENHLYHATLGMMFAVLQQHQAAIDAYLDALAVTKLAVEKVFIEAKIRALKKRL